MPKADASYSTPTRRALLGAAPAIAIAVASPEAITANPDAELMRLAGELLAEAAKYAVALDDDATNEVTVAVFELLHQVLEIPSQTSAGRRAKARGALAVADRSRDGELIVFDDVDAIVWQVASEVAEAGGV
jgi:hypothetical protein